MKSREMFKEQLNEMLDDSYWNGEEQRFEDVATQDIVTPFSVTKKGCLKKCEPGWLDDCNDCIFYVPFHCPEEEGYTCDEECSECSFMLDFTEKNDCLVALKKWLDSEYKMVVPKRREKAMSEKKNLFTEKDVQKMNMNELLTNNCYVKDNWARYRDYDGDMSAYDLVRKLCKTCGLESEVEGIPDERLDDLLREWLQYGPEEMEGIVAIVYGLVVYKAMMYEAILRVKKENKESHE